MRFLFLALFLLYICNSLYGQSTMKGLKNLNTESIVQITRDSHDSWIDWSNDDNSIFFISPKSGNNNLYQINVEEIDLTEVKPNIFAATYLIDPSSNSPIQQLTFEDEKIVESPLSIPNTNSVAFVTYKCDPYPCKEFDIRVLNLMDKEMEIVLEESSSILFYDFIDRERLIYVTEDSNPIIKELNLSKREKKDFLSFDTFVSGLKVEDHMVLVSSEEGIYSVDIESKKSKLYFSGSIFGNRISKKGDYIVGILPGPASGMINTKTKEETKFVDSYDYQPSLSKGKDYVALISEGSMGIIVKKLDR